MTTVAVSWWGHASTTIECGGVRVLTDPVFTARLAHLQRFDSPVPPADARRADVAVISHLHADHLHVPSLRLLATTTRIIAPRGTRRLLIRSDPALAARVEEVDVGDVVTVAGVGVRAVTAAHDGRRHPGSRHRGPALGYVLQFDLTRVWFAGDTGLFDEMAAIGPVQVAVVPVGGWGPTLDAGHLDARQAAEAVRRIGAHDAVPVHYGTFWPMGLRHVHPSSFRRMFRAPGEAFAADVAPDVRAHILSCGATVTIEVT
jgi:L-ascorbate metabolism protein UlaG (beta-lactamase superfamily)